MSYGMSQNKVEGNEVIQKVTRSWRHTWVGNTKEELEMVPMIVHGIRHTATKFWGWKCGI
jgi:hypothetical protein